MIEVARKRVSAGVLAASALCLPPVAAIVAVSAEATAADSAFVVAMEGTATEADTEASATVGSVTVIAAASA